MESVVFGASGSTSLLSLSYPGPGPDPGPTSLSRRPSFASRIPRSVAVVAPAAAIAASAGAQSRSHGNVADGAATSSTSNMLRTTLRRMSQLSCAVSASSQSLHRRPTARLGLASASMRGWGSGPVSLGAGPVSMPVTDESLMTRSACAPLNRTWSMRRPQTSSSSAPSSSRTRPSARLCRSTQTRLTRDPLHDDPVATQDGAIAAAHSVQFGLYMPDLLGAENEAPVVMNVASNRSQLGVGVRRGAHRQSADSEAAAESLSKELRAARHKLEQEQALRAQIERQLDDHNDKVRMIVASMDSVEREFERRDASSAQMQASLEAAEDMIGALRQDLERRRKAEREADELQEFVLAERLTLLEELSEREREVRQLRADACAREAALAAVEERGLRLARLGEQRHREVVGLQGRMAAMSAVVAAAAAERDSALAQLDNLTDMLGSLLAEEGSKVLIHHMDVNGHAGKASIVQRIVDAQALVKRLMEQRELDA